jgi:transcriptional regulator with XRE-family HTH domain
MAKPKISLSERVQDAAAIKGVHTPAQFADYLKVGRQIGHKWWKGNTPNIRAADLFLIADALQVSPRWLLTGEPPMTGGKPPTKEEQRALDLYRALPEAWREDWISDGNRTLERLNIAPSVANPFPRSR